MFCVFFNSLSSKTSRTLNPSVNGHWIRSLPFFRFQHWTCDKKLLISFFTMFNGLNFSWVLTTADWSVRSVPTVRVSCCYLLILLFIGSTSWAHAELITAWLVSVLTERTLRTERLPGSVRHFSFQSLQAAVDFIRIFKNNHDSRTIIVGVEWVRESGKSIVMFCGTIYAGSTFVILLQHHRKITI